MISYELAKQLKEAGFANDPDILGTQYSPSGKGSWLYGPKGVKSEDTVYVPTLSELIEACDCPSIQIIKTKRGCFAIGGDIKIIERENNWEIVGNDFIKTKGETIKIAVTNLYLAIKNK